MNERGLDAAARIGILGLDPLLFLRTRDTLERRLMLELANRMIEHKQELMKAQAIEIANAVGKMLGG